MRIRSIKPEFFDSPSTASCGPWARLLYIAMWCMADDWGVGSANLKEMAAAAFPNDDQWTGKELPSLCKEVADSFGVMFYTVRGRPYFEIPSWDQHQVTQRRAKRRNPTSEDPEATPDPRIHADLSPSTDPGKELPSHGKEIASTEQGNRGTGEQGIPPTAGDVVAAPANAPTAQTLLAEWIDNQPSPPPGRIKGHLAKEIKNLIDEGHPYDEVRAAVQAWNTKGLSPSTLPSVLHEIRNKQSASQRNVEVGRRLHERVTQHPPTMKEIF